MNDGNETAVRNHQNLLRITVLAIKSADEIYVLTSHGKNQHVINKNYFCHSTVLRRLESKPCLVLNADCLNQIYFVGNHLYNMVILDQILHSAHIVIQDANGLNQIFLVRNYLHNTAVLEQIWRSAQIVVLNVD